MSNLTGKFIVISGYPASGKNTIMNMLLERQPQFKHIISYTDRPKRPEEVNGVDYHFVSTKKFEGMIEEGIFFEYVMHASYYKGTSKKAFRPVVSGKSIIWHVEITRAATLDETLNEKFGARIAEKIISRTYKFILKPDNRNVALRRYMERDPNFDKSEFNRRYDLTDKVLSANLHKFPYILTNRTGQPQKTLNQIEEILKNKPTI